MGGGALLSDRRRVIAGCAAVLRDLHTVLFQCGSGDLGGSGGRSGGGAGAVRGAVGGGRCGGRHPRSDRMFPVRVDRGLGRGSRLALPAGGHHGGQDRQAAPPPDLAPAADAVLPATSTGHRRRDRRRIRQLAPDLRDDARPVVLEQFLSVGAECGPTAVRRLRQEILARYGQNDEFDPTKERCRRLIDLSPGAETTARGVELPHPTTRAAPFSRPRSGRCPHPSPTPTRAQQTPVRSGGAAATR